MAAELGSARRAGTALVLLALSACASSSGSFRAVEGMTRDRLGHADLMLGDGSLEGDSHDEDAASERLRGLLGGPIGPDEAALITLLASPEVRAALAELGIARAEVLRVSAPPNPELETDIRFGSPDRSGDEAEAHLIIDLAQLIVLPLRRAAEETALHAAELEAADRVLLLSLAARSAVIEAQRAEARRAAIEDVVDVTRAAMITARELHEAGNVARVVVVTEEAMHQEARLSLAQAELASLEAREDAIVAMGLFGASVSFTLAPLPSVPAETPTLAELEETAVSRSLRLAAIEETMRALGGRHGAARLAGLIPGLRAGVSASLADQTFAFGPAIHVDLPIFDQGLGEADAIEAELRVTSEEWTAAAIRVRSLVRRARNRALSFGAQATFCDGELLPARRSVLAETLLQYNAMSATPFVLLMARRAELEASLLCIDARADHALALAALEQILAGGSIELGRLDAPRPSGATSATEGH